MQENKTLIISQLLSEMKSWFKRYTLRFKRPSGTSRGILTQKDTYFLFISEGDKVGVGECGLLEGLSIDHRPDYEQKLQWTCQNIDMEEANILSHLLEFPSIQFGVEQALKSLKSDSWHDLYPSDFTQGEGKIPINGLVWMGSTGFMKTQIQEKLEQGFRCIKMKIGAIDFEQEYALLKKLRSEFSPEQIEIRVDANGAFSAENALEKLKRLSDLQIHSIEQPIKARQWEAMAKLCEQSPLPIALDEELIGVFHTWEKKQILEVIKPQYIILKPSLIGGYQQSEEWITLSENNKIGWWITSALESNIGLNAIAQWTYALQTTLPQGLGTGSLYTNNIPSPLVVENGFLKIDKEKSWLPITDF